MASHKLAEILKLAGRLTQEDIDNMSEEEAWQWLRSNGLVSQQVGDESFDGADS